MTTPTTPVPQSPLSLVQLAVIEQNVRDQISVLLTAPAVRANLNAGCYVPPEYQDAAKDCIERTVAAVVIEILTK